jgi:hypothetical protein
MRWEIVGNLFKKGKKMGVLNSFFSPKKDACSKKRDKCEIKKLAPYNKDMVL